MEEQGAIYVTVQCKDGQIMKARVPTYAQASMMGFSVMSVLFPSAWNNPNTYVSCSTCTLKDNCSDSWRRYIGKEIVEKCILPGLQSGKFSVLTT